MSRWIGKIFGISFIVLAGLLISSALFPSEAATEITVTTIQINTTWTKDGSPYVVNKLSIGATLTLEAGTIVKFRQDGKITIASGELIVKGEADNKVYFTSISDDSVGGDTDGIAGGTQQLWNGIDTSSINNVDIDCNYAEFAYARGCVEIRKLSTGYFTDCTFKPATSCGIDNVGTLNVERCTFTGENYGITTNASAIIKNSSFTSNGIRVTGGQNYIENCNIQGKSCGINGEGGMVSVINCDISSNTTNGDGLYLSGKSQAIIKNNRITGSCYPITFSEFNDNVLNEFYGNECKDNKYNGYRLSNGFRGEVTLKPLDKPYIFSSDAYLYNGGLLNITAGTVLNFFDRTSLGINGKLHLNGTELNPINFSIINGSATGSDFYISINNGSELDCKYVIISNLGSLSIGSNTTVQISDSSFISMNGSLNNYGNSTIQRCSFIGEGKGTAILNKGGTASIIDCSFKDIFYGINVYDGSLIVNRSCFSNCEYAIVTSGGNQNQVEVANSSFINNKRGIDIYSNPSLKVRNSNFSGNQFAVNVGPSVTSLIDCTWNYWGHEGGPSTYQSATGEWTALGDRIQGHVLYEPFYNTQRSDEVAPPKIIIEGVKDQDRLTTDPTIVVRIQDGVLKLIEMDDKSWTNGETLADGRHKLRVVAENFEHDEREKNIYFDMDKTPPTAVIDNGAVITGDVGDTITFSGNRSYDNSSIVKYAWRFSDGVTGEGPNIERQFGRAGEYSIFLTVTDDFGHVSPTVESKITIEEPASIEISGVEDGQIASMFFSIQVQVRNGTLKEVKLDDEIHAETSFTVTKEGNHTLIVTATTTSGKSLMKTIAFALDRTPPSARLGGERSAFIHETVEISGGLSSDNVGIKDYEWKISSKDGIGTEETYSGFTLKKTFDKSGDYTISLRVRDRMDQWSANTATMTLHVIYRPVEVKFRVLPAGDRMRDLYEGEKFNKSITTQAEVAHGTIQSMKLNDNVSPNPVQVKSDGYYWLQVVAVNDNNEQKTFSIRFSIDQTPPTAIIDRTMEIQGFNDNKPVSFYAGPCTDNTEIVSYVWSFSDSDKLYISTTDGSVSRGFTEAGTYTAILIAIDAYGNRSEASDASTMSFTIKEKGDTAISFDGVMENGRYNSIVNIQVGITGGTLKRVTLDGAEVQGNAIAVSSDGIHTIHAEAENELGYHLIETRKFTIDQTPPVAKAGPDQVITEGDNLTLVGGGYDTNDISDYKWVFANDEQVVFSKTLVKENLAVGEYTASLWVKDTFGNWSVQPDTVHVYVDYRPVKLKIDGVANNAHYNKDVTINVGVEDNTGAVASMTLNGVTYHSGDTVNKEGRYTLRVVVLNKGNMSAEQKIVFTIDKTPPIAEAGPDQHCFNDGQPLTFSGVESTDAVGIRGFEWTFTHNATGEEIKLSGPTVAKGFTKVGTYTVALKVTDLAGNVSQNDTCQVTVMDMGNTHINVQDQDAQNPEDQKHYNKDLSMHVTVDNGVFQKIVVGQETYTIPDVTLTADGVHQIYIEAMNEEGYLLTRRFSLYIDKTPPIADAGSDRRAIANQPIKFSAGLSRDNNGITEYRWEFSDGEILSGRDIEKIFSTTGASTVSLWVKDAFGNWSVQPSTVNVRVLDPGELSTLIVKVSDSANHALANTYIVVENNQGEQIKLVADRFGEVIELLEPGNYKVYIYRPGYKSAARSVTLDEKAVMREEFMLENGSDIITVTESRQLDLEEIRSYGIDTNDPANRFIFKFQIKLEYIATPIDVLQNIYLKDICLPKNIPDTDLNIDDVTNSMSMDYVQPEVMVIIMRGTSSVLKEFHELSMTIINGADANVSLDNTEAFLHVPDGLSLAPIPEDHQTTDGNDILKQAVFVEMGSIPGHSQKKVRWVLRGDQPGEYQPVIDYSGVLNPFGVKVQNSTQLKKPIVISDPRLLQLRVGAPSAVFANEPFSVTVELFNGANKPYYDAILTIDAVETNEYVSLLSNLKDLNICTDILQPGEKIALKADFLPYLSGLLKTFNITQIGGNVTFGTKILPDCPRLFSRVEAGDGKVTLEWISNPFDMFTYNVRRRIKGEEQFTVVSTRNYNSIFIDQHVTNFVTYEYVITTVDEDGVESEYSQVISVTPGAVTADKPEGSYDHPIEVSLSAGNADSIIYYTVDGSNPIVGDSPIYGGPIQIKYNTLIKAMAVTGNARSCIYEFLYCIEGVLSGDFVTGTWESCGAEDIERVNSGDQYQLKLSATKTFNWDNGILPAGYIRVMPEGNWSVEGTVTLESFTDGTNFASGYMVSIGTEIISWGFYRGVNLAMVSPDQTKVQVIQNGSSLVYLRIRKEQNKVYFEFRNNPDEAWRLGGSRSIGNGGIKAGVYARTWSEPHGLQVKFDRFTVQSLPSLDPVWEWRSPITGPEYHALANNAMTMVVPANRVYNQSSKSDQSPKVLRKDVAAGDWNLCATLDLEPIAAKTYFTGLTVHFGGSDWLSWGRQGSALIVKRNGKDLFTLAEAPAGPIDLQIQRMGYQYILKYRIKDAADWIILGSVDITTDPMEAGIITRTWNHPQLITANYSRMKLEKVVAKLSQAWSWSAGSPGISYSVLSSDGIAIKVTKVNSFDDSDAAHRVSRLQREVGSSDWQAEVKVTPGSNWSGQYLAGLQVAFGQSEILTWGLTEKNSLKLERAGQIIQEIMDQNGTIYLRVSRIGDNYVFAYRTGANGLWTEAARQNMNLNPKHVAITVKTYTPTEGQVEFTGLHFQRNLPEFWEWLSPLKGPLCEVLDDGSVRIRVPNDKTYAVTDKVQNVPRVQTNLAAQGITGDWTISTRLSLEEFVAGSKFKSGLCVDFGTSTKLTWGYYNGLNLLGVLSHSITKTITTAKNVEIRIRKIGTTYYLEYRPDENSIWEAAGKQVVSKTPVKVGVMTVTTSKTRVKTHFTIPELTRTIPKYQVTFKLKNAKWGMDVLRATLTIDQDTPLSADGSNTFSISAGIHKVLITAPGYKPYQKEYKIQSDQSFEILLEPEYEQPTVSITSMTPKIDPVTGDLSLEIKLTNTGADAKLWVRISLIDQQNKTMAVMGEMFLSRDGEKTEFNLEEFHFKLGDPPASIKTEILLGNQNGPVLAWGEAPIL